MGYWEQSLTPYPVFTPKWWLYRSPRWFFLALSLLGVAISVKFIAGAEFAPAIFSAVFYVCPYFLIRWKSPTQPVVPNFLTRLSGSRV